jgi:adenylate kinase
MRSVLRGRVGRALDVLRRAGRSKDQRRQSVTTRLVILGKQGAGKGTQCALLVEHYGIPHISTGDMLRAAVAEGTEFGLQAKAVMDAGDLVSDEIILGIVRERLVQPDAEAGFLLDGFPRTSNQADGLVELLAPGSVDLAINIDVPDEVVMGRMVERGRDDDTEEAIGRRLELYRTETAPLLDFFSHAGNLVTIDGLGSEDEVQERIVSAITEAIN